MGIFATNLELWRKNRRVFDATRPYTGRMDNTTPLSDAEALQAVRDRNAAYDGKLFFAVLTTGIYCRPSCSSRQANAENIRFFDSSSSAQAAGFRSCKRCKPETAPDAGAMIDVARYIEAHADEKLSLAVLSDRFELSPTHLQKAFTATFGLSPKVFQDGVRQDKFKSLLRAGESVTDAVYAAGYGSSSRVYGKAGDRLGMTPGEYKAGAKGEVIHYTCGKTNVGMLMLAATNKGVCFAMFDENKSQLLAMLKHEFPHAKFEQARQSQQLQEWFAAIGACLSTDQIMPAIPLDLRGTTFQMRVWQFLQTIAAGSVVTYRDVAVGIDQPTAYRAAATACAKNRVALLVPCHRVLRGDGGMGGYRWGVDKKRQLLEWEARQAEASDLS